MNKIYFKAFTSSLSLCACASELNAQSTVGRASFEEKPNVVFFYVDDLGYADLSYNGLSDYYETPNIDKFISQSAYFENSYAAAANSAPARACLMTGMYTPRHGMYTVNPADRGVRSERKFIAAKNNSEISSDFVTMAEMFKSAGYTNAQIGKWHLGDDEAGTGPISQGFDLNIAGARPGAPYSYFYPYVNHEGKPHIGLAEGKEGEYLTDRLTDEAIKFVNDNKDTPFFLYLAHHGVHTPLVSPSKELEQKYRDKPKGKYHNNPIYAAMIEKVDDSFGRLMQTLESLHLTDETIIVFYSDNGGSFATNNYPLRDIKGSPYEGGCRVPLAIRWVGKTTAGSKIQIPVTGVDFYPTFAKAVGAKVSEDLDGEDIFTLIAENRYDRDIFWHFPAYLEAYGKLGFRAKPYSTIRSGDWKLIYNFESETCELYNLKNDIGETKNLAKKEKRVCKQLKARLDNWMVRTNAPREFKTNPYYNNK